MVSPVIYLICPSANGLVPVKVISDRGRKLVEYSVDELGRLRGIKVGPAESRRLERIYDNYNLKRLAPREVWELTVLEYFCRI